MNDLPKIDMPSLFKNSIINIHGVGCNGIPKQAYRVSPHDSEHTTFDDVIKAYRTMHPSAVRIVLDIALGD